jgi:predicted aspartyl protease
MRSGSTRARGLAARCIRGGAGLLLAAAWLATAVPAAAEFFKYTDRQGRAHYVDEIWKIPTEYRDQADRYREKFDHLSGEQKAQVVQSDLDRQRALEQERQQQIAGQLVDLRRQEEEERLRRAERERQQEMRAAETPVTIANNQILVPVSFANGGLETDAHLIMDTGATHTVLYRPVANRLNILTLAKGQSKVAGGQTLHSEVGKVDSMRVGPITARDFPIVILSFEGGAPSYGGLLGMDFLSRVDYTIDYDAQVVRWKLRSR